MKVLLAKKAGFCMGVRRAVETTLAMIHKGDKGVATFGPLIHNPQVLSLLDDRGVRILKEVPDQESGIVIIRAHGIPPEKKKRLQDSGAIVKDATCPRVVKVQAIIQKNRKKGFLTIIVGDRNHAEVEGLMGYAGELGRIVSNEADIRKLSISSPYIIVSQTTQDETVFKRLCHMIMQRFPNGRLFNTICDSTHKRQEEVRNLCKKVQALVVVGGKESANTQRLGKIAKDLGCAVFMAETENDLDTAVMAEYENVGVTAGASTPTWLINRVVRTLEAIPGKDEGFLRLFLHKLLWILMATNIYVSLAGGLLAYAGSLLQGVNPRVQYFLISFCYIFAVHNLNRFTDQKSKKFNDPVQALFYERYRWPLFILSAMALAIAITLAYGLGRRPFLLLIGMTFFGLFYNVSFIPKFLLPLIKIKRLKEIPGSKTFFVAMAWAFITTLAPAWDTSARASLPMTLSALVFVLLLVYARSALFDVFDVQGDRIVGKETLPVCLGEKKTFFVLHLLMTLLVFMLLVLPGLGWMSVTGFWLIPGVGYLIVLTLLYEKGYVSQSLKLEFCLESLFFFIAGLAYLSAN